MGKKTLVAQAKDVRPRHSRRLTWFDKLPSAQQSEIKELIETYLAGELEGDWDCRQLYQRILKPNGYTVSECRFREFVREYREKKESGSAGKDGTAQGRKAGTRG